MTPEDAFLQSIAKTPIDDVPRLVFADWLEEQGRTDRAEFIRVQCELPKLTDDSPRQEGLEARERQLLEKHEEEWALPLRSVVTDDEWRRRDRWMFRRGFIDTVSLTAETFVERGEALFQAAPIQRFTLSRTQGPTDKLAACPLLGRIVRLGFGSPGGFIDDDSVQEILASPHLNLLRGLRLSNTGIGPSSIEALARSPLLAQLEMLNLYDGGGWLRDRSVEALAASPLARRLKSLSVVLANIGVGGVRAVASSPHLLGLRVLDLAFNPIGDEGCEAIASSPHLTGLRSLRLDSAEVGDRGLQSLAASPGLRELVELMIGDNALGEVGIQALTDSTNLRALRWLWLQETAVGDRGAVALAGSPNLRQLRGLFLDRTHVGDDGLRALATSPNLSSLTRLGLRGNPITDAGVTELATSPFLARLKRLDLSETKVSNSGHEKLRRRFGATSFDESHRRNWRYNDGRVLYEC